MRKIGIGLLILQAALIAGMIYGKNYSVFIIDTANLADILGHIIQIAIVFLPGIVGTILLARSKHKAK